MSLQQKFSIFHSGPVARHWASFVVAEQVNNSTLSTTEAIKA
jgi:hypothetical protein